jgi:serine/threonine protein kinase
MPEAKLPTSKRKRFKNEILFCQRSEHPNIVRVIDVGAVIVKKESLSFFVMPLYSKTLRSLTQRRIDPNNFLVCSHSS